MDGRVLVAYGTKHGATEEIAEQMGQVLREAGLPTDVLPADRVSNLNPYASVVIGSAVYAGRWRKEAAALLRTEEQALAKRPVWLFSSGPTGERDTAELMQGWRFPEALQPVADRIQPRDIAFFHGAIDMKKLGLAEKLIVKALRAPAGDFRDWEAIASWAKEIATTLKKQ